MRKNYLSTVLNAVSCLTLFVVKCAKIELCQSGGAIRMRVRASVLIRLCPVKKQNTCPDPHLAGATNGDLIDFQRWLAHPNRDGLAFLATGADTGVELEVIANHGYLA